MGKYPHITATRDPLGCHVVWAKLGGSWESVTRVTINVTTLVITYTPPLKVLITILTKSHTTLYRTLIHPFKDPFEEPYKDPFAEPILTASHDPPRSP